MSKLRWRIGKWASDGAFAHYKRKGTYSTVPHYLEYLTSWGYKRYGLFQSIVNSYRGKGWIKR